MWERKSSLGEDIRIGSLVCPGRKILGWITVIMGGKSFRNPLGSSDQFCWPLLSQVEDRSKQRGVMPREQA